MIAWAMTIAHGSAGFDTQQPERRGNDMGNDVTANERLCDRRPHSNRATATYGPKSRHLLSRRIPATQELAKAAEAIDEHLVGCEGEGDTHKRRRVARRLALVPEKASGCDAHLPNGAKSARRVSA